MEQAAQTSQTDAAKTTTEFEEFSATNIKNFTKGDFSLNNFFNCLKSERNRLITFILKYHQWPLSKIISPVKLAAAGFYYFNKDVVKCAFCHYTVDNWKNDDVPWLRHEQTNRDCPFVNLTCCGNIPLLVDDEVHTISKPVKFHRRIFKYSNLEKPDYNYQANSQNRLDTFEKKSWKTNVVEKQNLVEAGFFYTGVKDKVQCFHCGGFLANWQPGDVPKEEHARFFPNCHFMISTYGQTFVEYVQFKNQLIQIREKLTLGLKKDKTDLFYMRSIDYQQFIEIKNSTSLVIKRIGTTSDLRFMALLKQYTSSLKFLFDCQNIYQFLTNLGLNSSQIFQLQGRCSKFCNKNLATKNLKTKTSRGKKLVCRKSQICFFSLKKTPVKILRKKSRIKNRTTKISKTKILNSKNLACSTSQN